MNSPKNYVIALLVLATLGSSVLAWRQYQEVLDLKATALQASERSDLQKKIWDLQKANRDLQEQLAAANAREPMEESAMAAETPELRPGAGEGGPQRGPRGRGPQMAALRDLMAKPEVQAMISAGQKAAIDERYAALFKNLNLSPEQAEKLKALLIERQTAAQDVMAAARDQGLDPRTDRDAIRKLMTDARNTVNDTIKSTIGDAAYQQLNTYEQTMPQRNLVDSLQRRLSYSDSPLSTSQAEQLVQILAANAPAATNNGNDGGRRGGDFGGPAIFAGVGGGGGGGGGIGAAMAAAGSANSAPITAQAITQAQTVLTPTQVTALEQMQQRQQSAQQLQQLIRSTFQQNNANNAGGTVGQTGTRRRGGG